jgi:hypothetical protein
MTFRDRPEVVLARHFFTSLFDFGFLSDDGAESLKRALLGSFAVALALGVCSWSSTDRSRTARSKNTSAPSSPTTHS